VIVVDNDCPGAPRARPASGIPIPHVSRFPAMSSEAGSDLNLVLYHERRAGRLVIDPELKSSPNSYFFT